ncbi:MAG: hypothetical protein NTZ59_12910, partial [Bacteroidetes bacterium]|nr:hypothetical protein [Bacteroidota bacterium]
SSKIINASFNSNGTKVLATINNKGAYIYNLNTAKVDASFYVNNAICLDAIYSKDEQTIITTFSDSTIYFYNIKFNKVESSIKLPFVCNEIMLNASGSKLYCATDSIYTDYNIGENIVEKLTKCIELKTQKIDGSRYLRDSLLKLSSSEFANSFLFSKKILRSSKKQDLNYDLYKDSCFVLDKLSKKILLRFTDRYNAAHLFSYAKKNSLIAITSNNIISIFNTKKWTLLNKLRGYNTKVNAVTYNAKLNLLLSIHNNKIVKQWDLSNAKLSFSLKDPSLCSELSSSYYCNKNSIVLIEPCDKTITGVWDANTGKEITIDSASHSIYSDCANKYDSISSDYILNAISPNNIELISDNIDSINLLNKDNMTLIKTLYRRNDLGALLGNRLIKKVSFNKTGSYF